MMRGINRPSQVERGFKKGGFKKLIKFCKPFYLPLALAIICAMAATILQILSPTFLSKISTATSHVYYNVIGQVYEGFYLDGTPFKESSLLLKEITNLGILLVSFYAVAFVLSYIQSFILAGVNQGVTKKFRNELEAKINRVPLAYFDHSSYGDILSRITNDVDTIGQSLNQSINAIFSSTFLLVGVIIAMFTTCYQMAFTALATVPVSLVLIILMASVSQKFYRDQQVALGELNGIIEENYSGALVIKSFNAESRYIEQFKKANNRIYQNAWKSNFLSGLMMPITSLVSNLGYVAICIVGGVLFKNGAIEIGVITAFIVYLNLFRSPIQQMAQAMTYVQSMMASADRVFEFLEVEEQEDESNKIAKIENVKGEVEFQDVCFSYYPEKPIIKHFSAHIKPGAKVAIVGPTGAGKTTIVNLLMRFYEINSGKILIDGVNTRDMKRSDVRQLFSMVLQDTWIFSGTIRENIVYDKENVTDEELKEACEATNMEPFIEAQNNGLDTVLSEKTALSEGQRQLITIARAMIQDAPMLILDEATSNVDTRTEIQIQQAMDKLMEGRTSFIIAHRLSTIKNADLILVLKDGNIIEQGNHDQLLEQNGFYASLYNSQFEE